MIEFHDSRSEPLKANRLQEFKQVLLSGNQVQEEGLDELVENAKGLAYAVERDRIVGVAGLKRPRASYIRGISEKSKQPRVEFIGLELGWFVVLEEAGGNGIGSKLAGMLMKDEADPVFATTERENLGMASILAKCGFLRDGLAWPSSRQEGSHMELWIHD